MLPLKTKPAKGPRPPSDDPEVNAVRLGWTDRPTMNGYHWIFFDTPMGGSLVIARLAGSGQTMVAVSTDGHIRGLDALPGAKFLKIVTPRRPDVPPEAA